jgi:hypothetical protein
MTTSKVVVHHARCKQEGALRKGAAAALATQRLVRDMAEQFMTLSSFKGIPSPINWMHCLYTLLSITQTKRRNARGNMAWDRDRLLVDK